MPQGTAHTKSIPVDYFTLNDPVDFAPCLVALLQIDYRGDVSAYKDQGGLINWDMLVNGPNQSGIKASIGDTLVWDGAVVTTMRTEVFTDRYQIDT